MKTNFKSVIQILDHYKDQETCVRLLEQQRWNGKPVCPHCGYSEKIYKTNRGYRCAAKGCCKKFSVTVGTIYENSKIELRYWFAAIYLITAHKKGISSHQLSRDLGITQKSAWFVLHRVREMLKDESNYQLQGEIQADETFIGGKDKNKHQSRLAKQQRSLAKANGAPSTKGRSLVNKTPVMGMVETGGKLRTLVVDNTGRKAIHPFILSNVVKGSVLVTDEWPPYRGLSADYIHQAVQHKLGQYVRDGYHTNQIEGAWSLLKRGIVGIYHSVSSKHLHRYCDEFTYRYNSRQITDQERFHFVLTHSEKRLKYNDLIAK